MIVSLALAVSYVLAIIFIDTEFSLKRKTFNRFSRAIFFVMAVIIPALLFLIAGKFVYGIDWSCFFGVIFAIFLVGTFAVIGNYFTFVYNDWQIRRLREKIAKWPNGLAKARMEMELNYLESKDNRDRDKDRT